MLSCFWYPVINLQRLCTFSVWIIALLPPLPYPSQPRSQAGASVAIKYGFVFRVKAHSPELTSDRPESYVLLSPSHILRHRKVTGKDAVVFSLVHISP
ncbi:hypothetical protein L1987_16888 [Smallanthus sonchifolius]|uniref:Uncharacterized protein n=1 Tax=Smallanthus sonchifolius TaxID=185202 RepID=A0ACB9IWE9_9ASTR|nr:hypothetical protein L1987_16888 [Smallanthus sonchifolius]